MKSKKPLIKISSCILAVLVMLGNFISIGFNIAYGDEEVIGGSEVNNVSKDTLGDFRRLEEDEYHNGFKVDGSYQPAVYSEENNEYKISNAGQLYWFANKVNSGVGVTYNARLESDIVLNEGYMEKHSKGVRKWMPIGTLENRYQGTFDGAQHEIRGLYFKVDGIKYVGLFGYIEKGTVKNITIKDSYFRYKHVSVCQRDIYGRQMNENIDNVCIGGICGSNGGGSIINCHNNENIYCKGDRCNVGGICGGNGGEIKRCSNTGNIICSGKQQCYVGGICGFNGGKIEECSNLNKIKSDSGVRCYIGGICGSNNGEIEKCYNIGKIKGNLTSDLRSGNCFGNCIGVVGGICGSNNRLYKKCYNTGNVFGSGCQCGGTCGANTGNLGIDAKDRSYYLKDIGVKPSTYRPINPNTGGYMIQPTLELSKDSFINGEVCRLLNDGIEGEKPFKQNPKSESEIIDKRYILLSWEDIDELSIEPEDMRSKKIQLCDDEVDEHEKFLDELGDTDGINARLSRIEVMLAQIIDLMSKR